MTGQIALDSARRTHRQRASLHTADTPLMACGIAGLTAASPERDTRHSIRSACRTFHPRARRARKEMLQVLRRRLSYALDTLNGDERRLLTRE